MEHATNGFRMTKMEEKKKSLKKNEKWIAASN